MPRINHVKEAKSRVEELENITATERKTLRRSPYYHKIMLEWFVAKGICDLWHFARHILYRNAQGHYYEPFHKPMCLQAQTWRAKRDDGVDVPCRMGVCEVHRGSVKTQLLTIAEPIWQLVRDPSQRILIRTYTDVKADEIGAAIMNLCDKNRDLKKFFPWLRPAMNGGVRVRWSKEQMMFERDLEGIRTNSIEVCGAKKSTTGGHVNHRRYDDIETDESRGSDAVKETIIERWKEDLSLCEGGATTILIGTPHDKDGLMNAALKKRKIGDIDFGTMAYWLIYGQDTVKVFDTPYYGQECVLLPDRLTVRCQGAGFPVLMAGLKHHQAQLGFWSDPAKDRVCELREITWNDGEHFRMNRPIPQLLGQPLDWRVSDDRPLLPNRFTMDSADEPSEESWSEVNRKSIPQEKVEMGSYLYHANMKLDPRDPAKAFITREQVRRIDKNELPGPDEPQYWYRTVDLASPRKTKCRTVIMTGIKTQHATIVRHIRYGEIKTTDILLELFLGELRVLDWGYQMRENLFEEASREEVLEDAIALAEKDPYEYFRMCGGMYAAIAEKHFYDKGRMKIRRRNVPRRNIPKGQRYLSMQPDFEMGAVWILKGIDGEEQLLDDIDAATPDATEGLDFLDCLHDLIQECPPPRKPLPPKQVGIQYDQVIREAQLAWVGKMNGMGM